MLTKRQWLAERGLAKADGRGRFSSQAIAALDKAVLDGTEFAEPEVKAPKAAAITQSYDVKRVRVWAGRNGINVGLRGRIPAEVILRYLQENPVTESESVEVEQDEAETTPRVVMGTPVASTAVVIRTQPVRSETVAYGRAPRKPGDPESVSEPVVAIHNCGGCGGAIAYCQCPEGPKMPKYLGGEVASLTKPE